MTERDLRATLLWMAGTLLSFSATAVAVRELAGTLSVVEMLAFRNAIGLLILAVAVLAVPALRAALAPRRLGLHLVRNGLHFGGQWAWATALTLLPMATVFALEFTAPIWVALLAVPLLGERITGPRAGAIGLGFAGTLVVLRPGIEAVQPAAALALGCALLFAMVTVATKALTRTESTWAILFWMNLMQLPMNLAGSDPWFPAKLGASTWLPALAIGVCGFTSHLCLTNAYRHADATVVVPLDFLRIPLIAVVGWRLYAEPLDPLVFAGAGLIIAGILWNLRAERRGARAAEGRRGGRANPGL